MSRPRETGTDVIDTAQADIFFPKIADYEMLRKIGGGSFGDVWLARNLSGTLVAVKVVYRRGQITGEGDEREFEGLKRIEPISRSHPGLVDILHIGMDKHSNYFFYVMEAADDARRGREIDPDGYEARTLAHELETRGAMDLSAAMQVSLPLADAVAFLHEAGLVHRDLKPSNILFVDGVPKLGDFGLVGAVGEKGFQFGTRLYVPPEGPGTFSADVYALGRIFYQTFIHADLERFPACQLEGEGAPPEAIRQVTKTILKACNSSPKSRTESSKTLREELEEIASLRLIQTGVPHSSPPQTDEADSGKDPMVQPRSPDYLVQPADEAIYRAIVKQESIILVRGVREIGKTSAIEFALDRARALKRRVANVNLEEFDEQDLESLQPFYMGLSRVLAKQLGLQGLGDFSWNQHLSLNQIFERFIRREVLGGGGVPLVVALDGVDRLGRHSIRDDVFGLMRSWHNQRALDPQAPWSRLTLILGFATEPHLLVTDPNQSPFNVGVQVRLEDFSRDQVEEFNRRLGSPLKSKEEIKRVFDLIGGHPRLIRLVLVTMVRHNWTLATLLDNLEKVGGLLDEHLEHLFRQTIDSQGVKEGVLSMLNGDRSPSLDAFNDLRRMGIVAGAEPSEARFRCSLYETFLRKRLLEET